MESGHGEAAVTLIEAGADRERVSYEGDASACQHVLLVADAGRPGLDSKIRTVSSLKRSRAWVGRSRRRFGNMSRVEWARGTNSMALKRSHPCIMWTVSDYAGMDEFALSLPIASIQVKAIALVSWPCAIGPSDDGIRDKLTLERQRQSSALEV